jgi:hypothetical protein
MRLGLYFAAKTFDQIHSNKLWQANQRQNGVLATFGAIYGSKLARLPQQMSRLFA